MDYSKIPEPSEQCIVCGADLAHTEKHPSVLKLAENGDAERKDVCKQCWEKLADDHKFFSFWLARREMPQPDPRLTREQHRAGVFRLFESMLAQDDEKRFGLHLYVLAHTLMKYRMLKWEGSERDEDGTERILFRNPVTDERIRIREVDPDDDRLVAVMREIGGSSDSAGAPLEGKGQSNSDADEGPEGDAQKKSD